MSGVHQAPKETLKSAPRGLEQFIRGAFSSSVSIPTLTVSNIMDYLFKGQNWWEYAYETLTQMLDEAGLVPRPGMLDQIQAVSALKNDKSFIDKEWNIFEKAVLAMNGIRVLFFEKQNIPIEYINHGLSNMRLLHKLEISEEVKHYIGCEAINDDILWHPLSFIDECLQFSLNIIGDTIGLVKSERDEIRATVKGRFESLKSNNFDISKVDLDEQSVPDMMCARIIRSLTVGKMLSTREKDFLSAFESLQSGSTTYEGLSDDVKSYMETKIESKKEEPEVMDEESEQPSVRTSAITEQFDTLVKEAFVRMVSDAHLYFKDDKLIKLAGQMGLPIITGANLGGLEDSATDPDRDLEKNIPFEGTAKEILQQTIDNGGSDMNDGEEEPKKFRSEESIESAPSDDFNLFTD
jgi:hypothetical protein